MTCIGDIRIGVDLGGAKIEVIALDAGNAALLRRRVATPVGDYEGTVEAVAALVEAAEDELSVKAPVGIGTPGAISRATGRIKNANSAVLNGRPLKEDIERRLGREVRMANDANCFTLSEASDGAAAGSGVAFGVILGTGVGAGIVIDRRAIDGANGIAGEWGHNPLPWPRDDERPGPLCYCGKYGCVETWLSGPSLEREARNATGRQRRARQIAADALSGDICATESLVRYKDRLARALANVVNILDPDTIVLGGGVSNIADLYVDLAPAIARYAFSDRLGTRIVAAEHGDSSGVRGAAMLLD
jgi:fructokinase